MPPAKNTSPPVPDPRSATLGEIIGHDRVREYVRRSFSRDRLPQAILFDGPPGIGKSAMVYATAKMLLAGPEASESDFHRHARKVAAEEMIHPDLRILEPSGAGGQIKIETAREALDAAYTTPIESGRKVFVVDPADRLNPSSANSLLKLVEEPPQYLTILFATESVHMVLPTIRSRAARLRLHPIDEPVVAQWLAERFGADTKEARAAAAFSGGCPGRAIALLGDKALEARDALVREWQFFQQHGFLALFRSAHGIASLSGSLESILAGWTLWLRDAFVAASAPGRDDLLVNQDRAADLAAEAEKYGPHALGRCLECLLEARSDVRRMVNPQLFVETLLLRLGPMLKNP